MDNNNKLNRSVVFISIFFIILYVTDQNSGTVMALLYADVDTVAMSQYRLCSVFITLLRAPDDPTCEKF